MKNRWTGAFFVLPAVILVADGAMAKPRTVDLWAELKSARMVTKARIVAYEHNGLKVEVPPGSPEAMVVRYSDDPNWNPERFVHDWDTRAEAGYTAVWPPVGTEVLVIIDARHIVSLFAEQQGAAYRFWSPLMTGSVALFTCEPPAKMMQPLSSDATDRDWEHNKSWDGCLVPISSVTTTQGTVQ